MKYIATIDGKEFLVEVLDNKHVALKRKIVEVDFESVGGQPVYSLIVDGKSYEAYIYSEEDDWQVVLLGHQYPVKVEDEREKRLRSVGGSTVGESAEFHLKAPMPGMVVAIPTAEGEKVEKGQVLVILESMKMQNELKSPRAGMVHRIRVKAGEGVEQRQTLLSVV
jgi:biotin carboxyl carrier protein